jgi:membrane-bound lytic murein transglycosylase A
MLASAKAVLKPISFSTIAGWPDDDHQAALAAFLRSCAEIVAEGRGFNRPVAYGGERAQWTAVCKAAQQSTTPRQFFEESFLAYEVSDPERPEGLFTGYYEAEAEGSLTPLPEYPVAIYRKPSDLVAFDAETGQRLGVGYGRLADGKAQPYFTRAEIENGALSGRGLEIVWVKDWIDAFFIHVQGSGRVKLGDGKVLRLAYAAKNGQPYTSIGGLLAGRGAFTRDEMSMQKLRTWLAEDRDRGLALMRENKSFVFFQQIDGLDPALGPPGAQKVPLTPRRSLAVDRSLWMFGTPVWLDMQTPSGPGGKMEEFRHLLIAQDTGSAIKGALRGDVFWGAGDQAAETAGLMKSCGRMIVFLPKGLVPQ